MEVCIWKLRIATIFLYILLLAIGTEEKRMLKLTNYECKSLDENFATFIRCDVKAIKRDVSSLNVHLKLNTVVRDGVVVNMIIKKLGNARNPTIYNLTADGCDFMGNRRKYPLLNIAYIVMGMEKYSNLNHSCPYENEVILKDYRFNEEYVNLLPIPLGHYGTRINMKHHTKSIINFDMAYQFYEKAVYQPKKPR